MWHYPIVVELAGLNDIFIELCNVQLHLTRASPTQYQVERPPAHSGLEREEKIRGFLSSGLKSDFPAIAKTNPATGHVYHTQLVTLFGHSVKGS